MKIPGFCEKVQRDQKMTLVKFFVVIILGLYLAPAPAQTAFRLREGEKDLINTGFDAGLRISDFIRLLGDPKTSKFFKKVGKMAKFLGAAGGYVSLVLTFLPSEESEEMKHMKRQFGLVNTKLDKVTVELNNIERLIKYENQRSAYLSSAHAILYGHKRLFNFLDEVQLTNCTETTCPRTRGRIAQRYIASFDIKLHLDKIMHGAVRKTSVFGDQLLSLVKKTFHCDFSKLDQFTNGVLKLAFKGQQVILAHEKLRGSNYSVTESLNNWLKDIYELRSSSYSVKEQCFNNITTQLVTDIRNSEYQAGSSTNAIANMKVKTFLEAKYPWMSIIALSYNAHDTSKHCTINAYGPFWSMPSNKQLGRRTLIVNFIDANGSYDLQRYKVLSALGRIVRHTDFFDGRTNYCKVAIKIRGKMKTMGVWKFVLSLTVVRRLSSLAVDNGRARHFIRKSYQLSYRYGLKGKNRRGRGTLKVGLLIVLKSMEQATGSECTLTCKNNGRCRRYPYSSSQYCECKAFYEGRHCETHTEAELASTVDSMVGVTFKSPVLADIYLGIQDLRDFIGVSFVDMQRGISLLEAGIQDKFNSLSGSVANGFKWANLVAQYADFIQTIEYFNHRFEVLPKEYPDEKKLKEAGKRLAREVLHVSRGIVKALFYLHKLFVGKKSKPLLRHQPLLLVYMEQRHLSGEPCTREYKQAVDVYWRQLILLQQIGYMVWAQALAFIGRKSAIVSSVYKMRLKTQLDTIKNATCQYAINNSLNVQCEGHYLHPGMVLHNRCKEGYYVAGSFKTSCLAKTSTCARCQCFESGSESTQCQNFSGKCKCKENFYGLGCTDRDCVWGNWSELTACSNCGYGATKNRTREEKMSSSGNGTVCIGKRVFISSCFIGCCKGEFHCKKAKKCIQSSLKCDYDNNCGDGKDEANCSERCKQEHTWPTRYSYSQHRVWSLYDMQPKCNAGYVLRAFGLQKVKGRKKVGIRYRFTCCKLNKKICQNIGKHSEITDAHRTATAKRLSSLGVDCPGSSYLSSFTLQPGRNNNEMRYSYRCCELLNPVHKRRSRCYTAFTEWTADRLGNVLYLDSQYVRCRERHFLNYFRLQRKAGWWFLKGYIRYRYRCCRVTH